MYAWQQRVVDEAGELRERLDKLNKFMDSGGHKLLPDADADLLVRQRTHMTLYLEVLDERIARFDKPAAT